MKTLRGPEGISIQLDETQIFKDDPGQGTPVLVIVEDFAASWACATDTGELDCGSYQLLDEHKEWIVRATPKVEKWMADNGA